MNFRQSAFRSTASYGLCLALLGTLLSSAAVAQRNPDASGKKAAQLRPQLTPEERQAKIVERVWWNKDKKISALNLTPELRQKMDQRLIEFLEESQDTPGRDFTGFAAELSDGNWDKAQAEAQIIADNSAAGTILQTNLMIDIISMLSDEQRQIMTEKFRGMLRRPWVMNRGNGQTRRGPKDKK